MLWRRRYKTISGLGQWWSLHIVITTYPSLSDWLFYCCNDYFQCIKVHIRARTVAKNVAVAPSRIRERTCAHTIHTQYNRNKNAYVSKIDVIVMLLMSSQAVLQKEIAIITNKLQYCSISHPFITFFCRNLLMDDSATPHRITLNCRSTVITYPPGPKRRERMVVVYDDMWSW